MRNILGFTPEFSIQDAILSLADAYRRGQLTNPMQNPLYYNIKRMQELGRG